jgi:hypothetical protein
LRLEIDIPTPTKRTRQYVAGRSMWVTEKAILHGNALALRRCPTKDAVGKEYVVFALVKVPQFARMYVHKKRWVDRDHAWVDVLIALNRTALTPFLESGDYQRARA